MKSVKGRPAGSGLGGHRDTSEGVCSVAGNYTITIDYKHALRAPITACGGPPTMQAVDCLVGAV